MKVTPFTSNPERLQAGATVLVLGEPTRILDVRTPQGYPIVLFEGYTDRTATDTLRNTLIEIPEEELPVLPEGEYYVHDLEGIEVVTTGGEVIGQLEEVIQTGSNDVYLVRRRGQKDILIPALDDIVREVDLDARRMTVEVVPGLLDEA
jgi:16S rRNA processing protein RimM